jgi:hypothetical protein
LGEDLKAQAIANEKARQLVLESKRINDMSINTLKQRTLSLNIASKGDERFAHGTLSPNESEQKFSIQLLRDKY